ncbi:MAG: cobalamin-binding protein [Dehalococcoidia bacterium]|nr:cobalamin-binding protein [Dehalococcoidia bacterium]MSQ16078.1 cobalamin-binding protein [Dehalococcoidia bacterium]
MRICSLLPSATEMVYALGLGDQLVGVSHKCDYPATALSKPVVSRSIRDIAGLSSTEIDAIVQQARATGNPLHWIDGGLLRELKPDLILTQELCEVCAVGSGSVFETAAKVLDYQPAIVSLRPASLEDIFQNLLTIGGAALVPERAAALVQQLRQRVARVQEGVASAGARPRVLCVDWLEPLRNTGQWTPELVELAGGSEGLAEKWGISRELAWSEVQDYQPDYIMMMPCAFDLERAGLETASWLPAQAGWRELPAVRQDRVYLFDGRVPSRHGPRVVDVMEALAEAMYPERFAGLAAPGLFRKADLS